MIRASTSKGTKDLPYGILDYSTLEPNRSGRDVAELLDVMQAITKTGTKYLKLYLGDYYGKKIIGQVFTDNESDFKTVYSTLAKLKQFPIHIEYTTSSSLIYGLTVTNIKPLSLEDMESYLDLFIEFRYKRVFSDDLLRKVNNSVVLSDETLFKFIKSNFRIRVEHIGKYAVGALTRALINTVVSLENAIDNKDVLKAFCYTVIARYNKIRDITNKKQLQDYMSTAPLSSDIILMEYEDTFKYLLIGFDILTTPTIELIMKTFEAFCEYENMCAECSVFSTPVHYNNKEVVIDEVFPIN